MVKDKIHIYTAIKVLATISFTNKQEHIIYLWVICSFSLVLGCDANEQIHAWVDCTVVVEITSRVEWSNGLRIISSKVQATNLRSIWLRRLVYFPTRTVETVCDHVRIRHTIDQIERLPFLNRYLCVYKQCRPHKRFWIFGNRACVDNAACRE